ncbi:hypothetical protein E4U43_007262 [Claviceps pusilla]|uniref:Uncharacterized protein n=1 Tax=Claviceps pusilla TaxID=123648 RepID=A0A9P7T3T8_9HYPO|nr:hypothetical protein E4U43_007262 [Claviceps pusilla]
MTIHRPFDLYLLSQEWFQNRLGRFCPMVKHARFKRSVSTTARNLLKLVGRVTLGDVEKLNGHSGPDWAQKVQRAAESIESEVRRNILMATIPSSWAHSSTSPQGTDVATYKIRGALAHKSHDDPDQEQLVMGLIFFNAAGRKVGSAHVSEDGMVAFRKTRA